MKHKETYEIMTEKLWCKVKTARSSHEFIRLGMFRLNRYRDFFSRLKLVICTRRVSETTVRISNIL